MQNFLKENFKPNENINKFVWGKRLGWIQKIPPGEAGKHNWWSWEK